VRTKADLSAAHRYRASVIFRWHGVTIPGFGRLGGGDGAGLRPFRRTPRFDSPAACIAAAQQGDAQIIDAEEMVERQLRTAPATADMFGFLSQVVLALAQYGATHGIRLSDLQDCERILGWMTAEGLTPGDAQYRTLLSVMIADARWGRLGEVPGVHRSIDISTPGATWGAVAGAASAQGPGCRYGGEERAGVGGAAAGDDRVRGDAHEAGDDVPPDNVAPGLDLRHGHMPGRTCCSVWWRRVLYRMKSDGMAVSEEHCSLCMHMVAAFSDSLSDPLLAPSSTVDIQGGERGGGAGGGGGGVGFAAAAMGVWACDESMVSGGASVEARRWLEILCSSWHVLSATQVCSKQAVQGRAGAGEGGGELPFEEGGGGKVPSEASQAREGKGGGGWEVPSEEMLCSLFHILRSATYSLAALSKRLVRDPGKGPEALPKGPEALPDQTDPRQKRWCPGTSLSLSSSSQGGGGRVRGGGGGGGGGGGDLEEFTFLSFALTEQVPKPQTPNPKP
jgi:hypothetical protein